MTKPIARHRKRQKARGLARGGPDERAVAKALEAATDDAPRTGAEMVARLRGGPSIPDAWLELPASPPRRLRPG